MKKWRGVRVSGAMGPSIVGGKIITERRNDLTADVWCNQTRRKVKFEIRVQRDFEIIGGYGLAIDAIKRPKMAETAEEKPR